MNRLHRDRLAEALGQLRRQCRSVDPRERARSIDGRVEREDCLRDGEGEERAGEELGAAQGELDLLQGEEPPQRRATRGAPRDAQEIVHREDPSRCQAADGLRGQRAQGSERRARGRGVFLWRSPGRPDAEPDLPSAGGIPRAAHRHLRLSEIVDARVERQDELQLVDAERPQRRVVCAELRLDAARRRGHRVSQLLERHFSRRFRAWMDDVPVAFQMVHAFSSFAGRLSSSGGSCRSETTIRDPSDPAGATRRRVAPLAELLPANRAATPKRSLRLDHASAAAGVPVS